MNYIVRWQQFHYSEDGNRVYQGSEYHIRTFTSEKYAKDFYEGLCKDDTVYNIECF